STSRCGTTTAASRPKPIPARGWKVSYTQGADGGPAWVKPRRRRAGPALQPRAPGAGGGGGGPPAPPAGGRGGAPAGAAQASAGRALPNYKTEAEGYGAIRALDPKTGEKKWDFKMVNNTECGVL